MLGFGSQWAFKPKLENESVEIVQQVEVEENQAQEQEQYPNFIIVDERQRLMDLLPTFISEDVQAEVNLYPEFSPLKDGDQIEIQYVEDRVEHLGFEEFTLPEAMVEEEAQEDEKKTPLRVFIRRSKYEQLRIELTPEPSVIVDTFPLEPKSLVFTFTKDQLLKPNQELLDVLDAEPGLLGVIDNRVDIIKKLKPEDNIEVLAVGRYRGEKLQSLESVLSMRINQKDKSTLLFKYAKENEETWFAEDLTPCSFPFLQTPTDHILVSSGFGEVRGSKVHKAIDFAAPSGKPIYATADGVVSKAGWGTGYGMVAIIDHEDIGNYESVYAHMSRSYVKEGQEVRQGQLIGLVGNTGRSTGPHLHYEIRENHRKVNPRSKSLVKKFLPKEIDSMTLAAFRDQVDQVFVEATTRVVDVSDLLVRNEI